MTRRTRDGRGADLVECDQLGEPEHRPRVASLDGLRGSSSHVAVSDCATLPFPRAVKVAPAPAGFSHLFSEAPTAMIGWLVLMEYSDAQIRFMEAALAGGAQTFYVRATGASLGLRDDRAFEV